MKNSSNNGDAVGLPPASGSGWLDQGTRAARTPINETLQHVIGSQLKAAYDEVVRQPVPDRFMQLLSQLDSVESAGAQSGSDDDTLAARTSGADGGKHA